MPDIEYTIRRSGRARRVSVSVHHTGKVEVILPTRANAEYAEHFVKTKARWIARVQEKMQKRFANKIALNQTRKEYKELKTKSLAFIKDRIYFFNKHYKFLFKRISIRMQKSRWGSCSRKGNLNFNYGLVKLPEYLADYIIVHELCHLKEMNHGPKFWDLVSKTIPDHTTRRKELKRFVHIE